MDSKAFCLFAILGLINLQGSSSLFFGPSCPNGWNKLTVTFMKYYDIPMTQKEAVEQGWTKTDAQTCDGHGYFVGNRYRKDNENGNLALYDCNGVIAGIQASLPSTIVIPDGFKAMLPLRDGRYYITAYFTEPTKICKNSKTPADGCLASSSRTEGCVGNKLIIQTGQTAQQTDTIPYHEKEIATTKWTKGKCFYGMGQHYWYNVSTDMKCSNFYPVFLLYNGGVLNAFGWAFGGQAGSTRFEHPEISQLGYFFDPKTQPKCLSDYPLRSTQHIFLQSSNLKYIC